MMLIPRKPRAPGVQEGGRPHIMKLTVVVPCYNEEAVLPLFYEEAVRVLRSMTEDTYELLFIDDGSRDGTLETLRDLARKDPCVRYLSFSRNFGKEAGMYAGLQNARGDLVAIMDADLQDPPALLLEMRALLAEGDCDCVATRRVTRAGEPRIRSFFARRFYRVINRISEVEIADGARDFRLMTRPMVDALVSMGETNRFSKGLFAWVGFRTKWLEYENVERAAGETKWSFWSLAQYAVDGILNFSQAPLTIVSWGGIFLTIFAMIMVVFLVVRRLVFGDPVQGWASLACIMVFVAGLQLGGIGILGQYLAKTYMETKHRPLYIVAETSDEK